MQKQLSGSAFLSALENHGVWKEAQQSASGGKSNLVRNVLALDSFQQLFFHNPEDGSSSISVINLKRIRSEGADESYQTIRCKPPIEFPIRELLFNEKSNFLCAVGQYRCAVIEISDHTRREFFREENRSGEIECRTHNIGSFLHTTNPRLAVHKAAWHPLSDNHLAILASDNTLRIYDLASDFDAPEQALRLYELYPYQDEFDFTAVDFSFGSSRLGWDCFTIYFLMEEGEIFGLSPVVPYNALLSEGILTRLREKTVASMESDLAETAQQRYRTQLSWLTEVRGQTVLKSEGNEWDADEAYGGREQRQGKRKDRPRGSEGWILTRRPPNRLLLSPVLQGPLEPSDGFEPPKRGQVPVGILSIPSSPTVIIRCFLNGFVDIFFSFDDLEPDWLHLHAEEDVETAASLTTFDRIDLGLTVFAKLSQDEDEEQLLHSALAPIMSLDPVNKAHVYIRHAAGVHVLRLAWLDKLELFALSGSSSLPDLPPTEEEVLLQTVASASDSSVMEPSPLLGFEVVKDPGLLNFFVAITSTWKCLCIKLDESIYATSLPAPPTIPLSPITHASSSGPSAQSPFEAAILPLLEKRLPRIPPISTRDAGALSYSSPEALQFMVERCQLLRREYVLHIKSLSAEIHNQAKVLSSVHERQEEQARVVAEAVERLQQNGDVLQAKIEKAAEFQKILTQRSQLVMDLITSQKQGLSSAEKQFLKELREKKQMLPAFKAKIEQLRNQSTELLREQEETPYAISERHLKKIQPILEEEMKMIADTVDGMRKLQVDIEKEFPDT